MTSITVTIGDREITITDIATYRRDLATVRSQLATIYAGFDPAHPERLVHREPAIRELVNRARSCAKSSNAGRAAEHDIANVMAGWELVQHYEGNGS